MFEKLTCYFRGHVGPWRQTAKPWRFYRECERCGRIDYTLDPKVQAECVRWLMEHGYPNAAKLLRGDRR